MSSPFLDHDTLQHLYDATLGSHFAWKLKAGRLFLAAETLWDAAFSVQQFCLDTLKGGPLPEDFVRAHEKFELAHIGTAQAALAIECALKALWVPQNRSQIQNITKLSQLKPIWTHDLAGLAVTVGMTLTADEKDLLDCLTEHSLWYGRYMAPTTLAAFKKSFDKPPLGRFLKGTNIFTYDLPYPQEIKGFIRRLIAELDAVPPADRY